MKKYLFLCVLLLVSFGWCVTDNVTGPTIAEQIGELKYYRNQNYSSYELIKDYRERYEAEKQTGYIKDTCILLVLAGVFSYSNAGVIGTSVICGAIGAGSMYLWEASNDKR